MRIHHLATTAAGGAGKAAEKLAAALQDDNHQHRLFCADPRHASPAWTTLFTKLPKLTGPRARWHRLLLSLGKRRRPKSPESLSQAHLGLIPPLESEFWNCDLVHLQWLGWSWLDFARFAAKMPAGRPVVWTLHDLNPVTALCHYPGSECTQLAHGCQSCPWVEGALTGDVVLHASFKAKKAFFESVAPYLVTICDWQDKKIKSSPLGKLASGIRLIPNSFDAGAADARIDRRQARVQLGLDPDANYALVGASNVANTRKGLDLIFETARHSPTWKWLSFGDKSDAVFGNMAVTQFGMVRDQHKLGQIYAAANVFVLPSREECLAQTGLEALANGTPVITVKDTGPADYVLPGKTGLLAADASSQALAEALASFPGYQNLQNADSVRKEFGVMHAGRFSKQVVRDQYNDLYETAIRTPRRPSPPGN